MGGHGGLNILPQKRWNVYRFDNIEKVRKDEEAAAKEEQLKNEQTRKREAEFRLERLRASRGLAPLERAPEPKEEDVINKVPEPKRKAVEEPPIESEPKSGHINLFEGIKIFDPIRGLEKESRGEKDGFKNKKIKKEEAPKVMTPEDEKYRLGYGVAGKGVKLPWYLESRKNDVMIGDEGFMKNVDDSKKKNGKKTLKELREERLQRERREKERERAVMIEKERERSKRHGGFSRRLA